jgi:anti-sigma regulatory factor (Ser/Thr protein kinase)
MPDELTLHLPATPAALPELREQLAAFLDARGIGEEDRHDALAVAHELAANAIAHGSRSDDDVGVHVDANDDRLRIVVSDAARRPGVPFVLTPDDERERGRGLQLVDRLADWSETIVDGRREVRAELRH